MFKRTQNFFKYSIFFPIVFVMVLGVGGLGFSQVAEAQVCTGAGGQVIPNVTELECRQSVGATWTPGPGQGTVGNPTVGTTFSELATTLNPLSWAKNAFTAIVQVLLTIVGYITGLAGVILNGVIYYTIVLMAQSYNDPNGLGAGISAGWGVVRDVANMGFIFILLYAAISTILGTGGNNQTLIVRVVVIAILINFSMFFTRIVVDAANVLALFFYDAIAPNAASSGFSLTQSGLSNAFMNHLHISSLYKSETIDLGSIATIGVMGIIMLLITAFVFLAVSLMLIIRYVVLIFTIILSPLAFMGWVIPGLKSRVWDKWWDALSGQAFFAPIYFLLTWVTLRVLSGVMTSFGLTPGNVASALSGVQNNNGTISVSTDAFSTMINFIVVIVFLIASLIISKDWANKTGGGINKLTGWATGVAGGATLGAVGYAGRNVIGSRASAMANDENLKQKAAEGSVRARLQLAAANRAAKGSYDLRSTGLGGTLDAGKVKKGANFEDEQKARIKSYEKYKPDSGEIKSAENLRKEAEKKLEESKKVAAKRVINGVPRQSEFVDARKNLADAIRRDRALGVDRETIKSGHDDLREKIREENKKYVESATSGERSGVEKATAREDAVKNRMENMAKKAERSWYIPGLMVSGKDKAEAIRKAAKGKSKADKLYEDMKKAVKEEGEPETPQTPPPAEGQNPTS